MTKTRNNLSRRVTMSFLSVAAAALIVAAVGAITASAQSPTPTNYMEQVAPGGGFPSGAQAVVVEGTGAGLGGCSATLSSIETATVNFINGGRKVVTEVSPQSYCGSISGYEGVASSLETYVEAHANNPGTHWAGIMLDEEPDFGFTASELETLNSSVQDTMAGTPGMSWLFTENYYTGSSGTWTESQYLSIITLTWPAPQVYSAGMSSLVNSECTDHSYCTNNVTTCIRTNCASPPWNSVSYATSHTNGVPWNTDYWSGYWYNFFQ